MAMQFVGTIPSRLGELLRISFTSVYLDWYQKNPSLSSQHITDELLSTENKPMRPHVVLSETEQIRLSLCGGIERQSCELHSHLSQPERIENPTTNLLVPDEQETTCSHSETNLHCEQLPADDPLAHQISSTTQRSEDLDGEIAPVIVPPELSTASTLVPERTQSQSLSHEPNDLLLCGIPVPGSRQKKNIYLTAVASTTWTTEEYTSRFEYVVGELRRAVDAHSELRDRARFIVYDLRMVGTSLEVAVPSIIIRCKKSDSKSLRALFTERATDRLYCRKDSTWSRIFKDSDTPQPPFKLVYYQTDVSPIVRKASDDSLISSCPREETLCGSLIQYRGRTATVGLTIEVDGVVRLLTVDHLFQARIDDITYESRTDEETIEIHPENSQDFVQFSPLWVDDSDEEDELDDCLTMDYDTETKLTSNLMVNRQDCPSTSQTSQTSGAAEARKTIPPCTLELSSPYLDWALAELSGDSEERMRMMDRNWIYPDASLSPILLQEIATQPRFHGVPVYMISGVHGIRSGRLLSGFSYVGSQPGQNLCPTWTMILESPQVIDEGECGSIIVDREDFKIYGHVVGSDDNLNHAYIVPLMYTMEQLELAFNTRNISLLMKPRRMLDESITTVQHDKVTKESQSFSVDRSPSSKVFPEEQDSAGRNENTRPGWGTTTITGFRALAYIVSGILGASLCMGRVSAMGLSALSISLRLLLSYGSGFSLSVGSSDVRHLIDQEIDQENDPVDCRVDRGSWSWHDNIGSRLMTWLLPIIVLIANLDISPIDKRRVIDMLHVIGDPIDSLWSLTHKTYTWDLFYSMALSKSPVYTRTQPSRSRLRTIATVLAGFSEISGVSLTKTDYYDKICHDFGRLGEHDEDEAVFELWQKAARDLSHSRRREFSWASLAILIYVTAILAAGLSYDFGDTSPLRGSIAAAISLSWLLPVVIFSTMTRAPRSCYRIISQFLLDMAERDIEIIIEGVLPFGVKSKANHLLAIYQLLEASWVMDSSGKKRRVSLSNRRICVMFASILPVVVSISAAVTIVSYSNPATYFNYRQASILSLGGFWILSFVFTALGRRVLRGMTQMLAILAKDIMVLISSFSITIFITAGVLNNYSCRGVSTWLGSNMFGINAAPTPLNTDRDSDTYSYRALYIAVVCIQFQVLHAILITQPWRVLGWYYESGNQSNTSLKRCLRGFSSWLI